MKLKSPNYSQGNILVVALLALVLITGGGLAYWRIKANKKQAELQQKSLEVSSNDPNTGTFSQCVKNGGQLGYLPSSGPETNQETVDDRADSLQCYGKGNVTGTPETYFAHDESGFDARCLDQSTCDAIEHAALTACARPTDPNGSLEPTFKYRPVIAQNWAKLEVTDCSSKHLRDQVILVAFVHHREGGWYFDISINPNNYDVNLIKAKGVPEILLYYIP